MGLQDTLNAMKKESIASRPPEVVQVLLEEVEKLVKSGITDNAAKPGESLPDFSLPDERTPYRTYLGLPQPAFPVEA